MYGIHGGGDAIVETVVAADVVAEAESVAISVVVGSVGTVVSSNLPVEVPNRHPIKVRWA